MSGIIGNGNALLTAALLDDIICQALGRAAYHINVHAVNTGTNNTTQSGGTELQIHIKTFFNLVFIMLNCLQFCLSILIEIRIGQPFPVNLHVVFHKNTFLLCSLIFKTVFIIPQ